MDRFQLLRCLQEHMDILLQTIISEFSIKAPKDPKNPLRLDLTTIEGVAAIFAIFATRRFGWPMATLLLAPAEGWGTLRVPRLVWTQLRGPSAPNRVTMSKPLTLNFERKSLKNQKSGKSPSRLQFCSK